MAKTKKSVSVIGLVLGFILGVLIAWSFLSRPDEKQHMDKLKEAMYETVENNSKDNGLVNYIGKMFVDKTLEESLVIKNYIFFSVGHIIVGSDDTVVTVGAFDHVFLTSNIIDNKR